MESFKRLYFRVNTFIDFKIKSSVDNKMKILIEIVFLWLEWVNSTVYNFHFCYWIKVKFDVRVYWECYFG